MTTTDKEGKQMLMVTVKNFESKPAIATARPALAAVIVLVKAQITKIINTATKQGTPTDGETKNLAKRFDLLCKALFRICGAASGYASSIDDDVLKSKVNFTLAAIEAKLYNGIGAFADGVIAVVTPLITASTLVPFGADTPQLTAAVNALQDFRDAESDTEAAEDERAVQTGLIHPYVKEGKRLLDELADPIAATLFEEDSEWYKLWLEGRKIDHFPHGTTIAEGFVLDKDGKPIYGATVLFQEQNISVETLLDGSYKKPHFPHGVTTPKITHPDFTTFISAPYEIKQGKIVHKNFTLQPGDGTRPVVN